MRVVLAILLWSATLFGAGVPEIPPSAGPLLAIAGAGILFLLRNKKRK